jgi:hypothetical protein
MRHRHTIFEPGSRLMFGIDHEQARRQLSGRTRPLQPGAGKLRRTRGCIWIVG